MVSGAPDPATFGQRLRHFRRQRGLTLAQLATLVDKGEPFLSMIENGKREPRLGLVNALAAALVVPVTDLLSSEPPSRRAELEIELERAQQEPLYRELDLPRLAPSARLPDAALEHIVGLFQQLKLRSNAGSGTPAESRRSNARLREEMRCRDNYVDGIEQAAAQALAAAGYPGSGALSERILDGLAAHFGFSVRAASDLPRSVHSITDRRRRRIFIPQPDSLPAYATRSLVLQALGHIALDHSSTSSTETWLRQHFEAGYFAGAVLAPEQAAVALLQQTRQERDLSIHHLRDTFCLSYEMAAFRFINLATRHLGVRTHFVRTDEERIIWKAYENDGVPLPHGADQAVEGQKLCRNWGTRPALHAPERLAPTYQYLDTPAGTFWNVTQLEADAGTGRFNAVTVGVPWEDARFFRGRNTDQRFVLRCPEGDCCRQPASAPQWEGQVTQSQSTHSAVLGALAAGTFSPVDPADIYEFLDNQPL